MKAYFESYMKWRRVRDGTHVRHTEYPSLFPEIGRIRLSLAELDCLLKLFSLKLQGQGLPEGERTNWLDDLAYRETREFEQAMASLPENLTTEIYSNTMWTCGRAPWDCEGQEEGTYLPTTELVLYGADGLDEMNESHMPHLAAVVIIAYSARDFEFFKFCPRSYSQSRTGNMSRAGCVRCAFSWNVHIWNPLPETCFQS